jgi:hypothetical protein
MLEALVLAGGLGFLLGLRYRVPAVVPASAVTAVMGPVVAYLAGAEWWLILTTSIAAVVVLQIGYLAGLLLTYLTAPRARPDHHRDMGSPDRYWADAKD